jgi:hypothetical protein
VVSILIRKCPYFVYKRLSSYPLGGGPPKVEVDPGVRILVDELKIKDPINADFVSAPLMLVTLRLNICETSFAPK